MSVSGDFILINIEKHSKINTLKSLLCAEGVLTKSGVTFTQLTTIGCGGNIALTVYPISTEQLAYTVKVVRQFDVPYAVLGRGSNVLASESDFWGVVIVTTRMTEIHNGVGEIKALCGTPTVALARLLADNSCGDGEFLHCLPATVGGAAVMNAGCFGQNMAGIVSEVTYIDDKGNLRTTDGKDCDFGYRNSIFKQNADMIVAEVTIKKRAVRYDVATKCKEMFEQKRATQPLSEKSFGCAFYSKDFAASRLIDLAGLKGLTIGGAKVSEKHAGFVINVDKAKSQDIYLLLTYIKDAVRQKFRCQLNTEVCLLGARWENINDTGRLSYTYTQ